jgi:hypothetical protein
MKTLTLRVAAVLLFASGVNPAAAQATAGVPPAIGAQVEVWGPAVDPAAGRVVCHRDLQCPVMYGILTQRHISSGLPRLNFIRAR